MSPVPCPGLLSVPLGLVFSTWFLLLLKRLAQYLPENYRKYSLHILIKSYPQARLPFLESPGPWRNQQFTSSPSTDHREELTSQKTWLLEPALPPTSCVTLAKNLNVSEPQVLYLKTKLMMPVLSASPSLVRMQTTGIVKCPVSCRVLIITPSSG